MMKYNEVLEISTYKTQFLPSCEAVSIEEWGGGECITLDKNFPQVQE